MKHTSLLLVALASLALVTPTALAASGEAVVTVEGSCVPNPDFSPFSDLVCCTFNTLDVVRCIGH